MAREHWEEERERAERYLKWTGKLALKYGGKIALKFGGKLILKLIPFLLPLLVAFVVLTGLVFLGGWGGEELLWKKYEERSFVTKGWNLIRREPELSGLNPYYLGFLKTIAERELGGFRMENEKTVYFIPAEGSFPATSSYTSFVLSFIKSGYDVKGRVFRFGAFLPDSLRAYLLTLEEERDPDLLLTNRVNAKVAIRILRKCMNMCGGVNIYTAYCYAYSETFCEKSLMGLKRKFSLLGKVLKIKLWLGFP